MHVLAQRPCKHMGIKNITGLSANMGKVNSTALNTGHKWYKKVSNIWVNRSFSNSVSTGIQLESSVQDTGLDFIAAFNLSFIFFWKTITAAEAKNPHPYFPSAVRRKRKQRWCKFWFGRVIKTFTLTFFIEHLFKLGLMQAIPYVFWFPRNILQVTFPECNYQAFHCINIPQVLSQHMHAHH